MAQHHMTEIRRRHAKRQRPVATEEVDDATTTVPRAERPVATTVEDEDEDVETTEIAEEEPATTRRGARPRPTEETTSEVLGAPTPAQATQITTTDAEEPLVTAAVPTTAPIAPEVTTTSETLTPVAPVIPTTRSTPTTSSIRTTSVPSSSILPSSSPISSSPLPVASAADANNATSRSDDDSSFPIGTVVGVIVAVVAVVALLVGFLIWRKKRRSRDDGLGMDAAMGGYTREKSQDNEFGEKPQDYSMAAIPPAQRASLQQQHGAPLPSPIAMPVQQRQSHQFAQQFNTQPGFHIPHSASMPNGFAPPKAAMMGSPSIRSSVASPYGLIAAAGLSSPPQQQESFQQEDQGPFEDPQWANKLFTVNRTFEPSMPDELVIYPGDTVRILMAYDDGWVLGENLSAVKDGVPVRGVFPRDCVEDLVEPQPQQMDENMPLQQESNLTRAPTLPPLNLGRESQSFQTSMAPNRASIASVAPIDNRGSVSSASQSVTTAPSQVNRASLVSMHQQHLARQSRQSLAPVIAIEEEPHASEGHMSNSSSLNGAIGQFPNTPSRQLTPVVEDDQKSARSLKRTSSLMASKDQDLFAQLGQVMQGDIEDETEEKEDRRDSKASK